MNIPLRIKDTHSLAASVVTMGSSINMLSNMYISLAVAAEGEGTEWMFTKQRGDWFLNPTYRLSSDFEIQVSPPKRMATPEEAAILNALSANIAKVKEQRAETAKRVATSLQELNLVVAEMLRKEDPDVDKFLHDYTNTRSFCNSVLTVLKGTI